MQSSLTLTIFIWLDFIGFFVLMLLLVCLLGYDSRSEIDLCLL